MANHSEQPPTDLWQPSRPRPWVNSVADDQISEDTVRPVSPVSASNLPGHERCPSHPAELPQKQLDPTIDPIQDSHPPKTRSLWRLWILEWVAILFSFASFTVIITILAVYDDRSLPDWPLGITLNTFLAFFTTLAQAGFMLPVSAAISQTKWTWFLTERPLYDFHIFTQASSGLWGPLVLLWKIHRRHFITVGAFLMVVSTLTSPITQLAIKYPWRSTVIPGEATVGAIRTINSTTDDIDRAVELGVTLAVVMDDTNYEVPISPNGASCSSGNCTFNQYKSLGVCVKFANITSHLQVQEIEHLNLSTISNPETIPLPLYAGNRTWKVSLPGALPMYHQNSILLYSDMLTGNKSFGFENETDLLQTRMISLTSIYTTPTDPKSFETNSEGDKKKMAVENNGKFRYEAREMLFYPCVQSFETRVEEGKENTRMIGSHARRVEKGNENYVNISCTTQADFTKKCYKPWDDTQIDFPGSAEDSRDIQQLPKDDIFSTSYKSIGNIGISLYTRISPMMLLRYVEADPTGAQAYRSQGPFDETLISLVTKAEFITNTTERELWITNLYTSVATSLSSVLRNAEKGYAIAAFNMNGSAWQTESYVHIAWGWISFIAAELVLAICLLALTIATQSAIGGEGDPEKEDHRVIRGLKDSALATLVVLGNETRTMAGGGLGPAGELEKASKEVMVKLEGNSLVLVRDTPESKTSAPRCDQGGAD